MLEHNQEDETQTRPWKAAWPDEQQKQASDSVPRSVSSSFGSERSVGTNPQQAPKQASQAVSEPWKTVANSQAESKSNTSNTANSGNTVELSFNAVPHKERVSIGLLAVSPFLAFIGLFSVFTLTSAFGYRTSPWAPGAGNGYVSPPAAPIQAEISSTTVQNNIPLASIPEGVQVSIMATDLASIADGTSLDNFTASNVPNLSSATENQWPVVLRDGNVVAQAWRSVKPDSSGNYLVSSVKTALTSVQTEVDPSAFKNSKQGLSLSQRNPKVTGNENSIVRTPDGAFQGSGSPVQQVGMIQVPPGEYSDGWGFDGSTTNDR